MPWSWRVWTEPFEVHLKEVLLVGRRIFDSNARARSILEASVLNHARERIHSTFSVIFFAASVFCASANSMSLLASWHLFAAVPFAEGVKIL